ncbi:MAG: type II toxin-antitoxin system RelE/ParE family toxin [Pseudomonadota bacterium]
MRIYWTGRAERDADEITDYIAEDNPVAAVEVRDEIERHVDRLADHPSLGRPGRSVGTRELIIPGLPYIVAYRVRNEMIEILRVLHVAQVWPERL